MTKRAPGSLESKADVSLSCLQELLRRAPRHLGAFQARPGPQPDSAGPSFQDLPIIHCSLSHRNLGYIVCTGVLKGCLIHSLCPPHSLRMVVLNTSCSKFSNIPYHCAWCPQFCHYRARPVLSHLSETLSYFLLHDLV